MICSRQTELVLLLVLGLCTVMFCGSLGSPRPPPWPPKDTKRPAALKTVSYESMNTLWLRWSQNHHLVFMSIVTQCPARIPFTLKKIKTMNWSWRHLYPKKKRETRAVRLRSSATCNHWARDCPPHPPGSGMGGTSGSQWPHWTWSSPLRSSHPHCPAALGQRNITPAQTAPRMRSWGSGTNLLSSRHKEIPADLCSWAPEPTSFCNFSLVLFFSSTSFLGE